MREHGDKTNGIYVGLELDKNEKNPSNIKLDVRAVHMNPSFPLNSGYEGTEVTSYMNSSGGPLATYPVNSDGDKYGSKYDSNHNSDMKIIAREKEQVTAITNEIKAGMASGKAAPAPDKPIKRTTFRPTW